MRRTKKEAALLFNEGEISCSNQEIEEVKKFAHRLTHAESQIMLVELERVFSVLGNRKRLMMILLLRHRPMCVCEIAEALEINEPLASHELSVLENSNLVLREKRGKWAFYKINGQSTIAQLLEPVIRRVEER